MREVNFKFCFIPKIEIGKNYYTHNFFNQLFFFCLFYFVKVKKNGFFFTKSDRVENCFTKASSEFYFLTLAKLSVTRDVSARPDAFLNTHNLSLSDNFDIFPVIDQNKRFSLNSRRNRKIAKQLAITYFEFVRCRRIVSA